MADRVKTVRGMDIIPEGIEDAKANAKLNGANNCHYEVGKAEVLLTDWFKAGQRIDALVVDPPRTGLTEALAKAIARLNLNNSSIFLVTLPPWPGIWWH